MRRDSYLGLKGLTSCHGVYFPGTPFFRSLSKVLGCHESALRDRDGWR